MGEGSGGNCTKKRVAKSKIAHYRDYVYPRNMLKRAQRVYARLLKTNGEEVAREHAQRCASAHGPMVEGALSRWMRGEKPFQS